MLDPFDILGLDREDVLWPADFPRSPHEAIARHAKTTPDAPAVIDGDRVLSYLELDRRVAMLARALSAGQIGRADVVAIALPRGADLVVTVLAALHIGATYLLLDVEWPTDVSTATVRGARARLLICEHPRPWKTAGIPVVSLADVGDLQEDVALIPVIPSDLAYIVRTSGSTGLPKLVEVTHGSLAHHAAAMAEVYELRASDRVLQFANPAFDVFVEEVFPTLSVGAAVVVTPTRTPTPAELTALVADHAVTVVNLPTPYWRQWVAEVEDGQAAVPDGLRLVIIGSDIGYTSTWRAWRKHTQVPLINAYGATETTVTCAVWRDPGDGSPEGESLPIGKAIPGVYFKVYDKNGEVVTGHGEGELFVYGPVVAAGYRDEPGRTAAVFAAPPAATGGALRRYRTRDRVRLDSNGNVVFLSRCDDQVKVRGYSVDPRETTLAILSLPGITQAHTVAREDRHSELELITFVVGESTKHLDGEQVRQQVADQLPAYQRPRWVLVVEAFPLTPNGKIDESALPLPPAEAPGHFPELGTEGVERLICRLWSDDLGRPVDPRDNVFDLGAHSLMLAGVRRRLVKALDREVAGVEMFEHPTPAALAAFLVGGFPSVSDVMNDEEGINGGPDQRAAAIRRRRARRQAMVAPEVRSER